MDLRGRSVLTRIFEATLRRLQAEILGRTGLSVIVGAARRRWLQVGCVVDAAERCPTLC